MNEKRKRKKKKWIHNSTHNYGSITKALIQQLAEQWDRHIEYMYLHIA